MNILESISFVKGSINENTLVPELKYFRIADGIICGSNSVFCLSAPILLDINCNPEADTFVKLLHECKDTPEFRLNSNGKLIIKSGNLKGNINTLAETPPVISQDGEIKELVDQTNLIESIKDMYKFISEDASRPWSMGLLIMKDKLFATNNIILAQCSLPFDTGIIANIPKSTIKEMIRINENPISLQANQRTVTINYTNDRKLTSVLCDLNWPNILKLLDFSMEDSILVRDDFFNALKTIKPFCDKLRRVYIQNNIISSSANSDDGILLNYDLTIHKELIFNIDMLLSLKNNTDSIQFNNYPTPSYFATGNVKGVIASIAPSNAS